MKTILSIVSCIVSIGAEASIINSASCNYNDVISAVSLAQYGDVVVLPNGSGKWTGAINISGITLAGQGTNNTIISDETPLTGSPYSSAGTPILSLSLTNAALTRVTGIQFTAGITNNIATYPGNYGAEITIGGNIPKWQIDNCSFILLSGKNIRVTDDSFGIISTCYFHTQDTISLEVFGNGYGDVDWSASTTYGSTNSVFFENNYCIDNFQFGWVDCSQGGRLTYRYNAVNGCYVNTHGAETSQRYRSSRWVEIYNNVFTNFFSAFRNQPPTALDLRGGGALVFSNTVYGYKFMTDIEYYRAGDNNPGFTPWFGMTGISGWDNNGSTFSTVASETGNSLIVHSASWTVNQWYGYTVYNFANQLCGVVNGNNNTNITFMAGRDSAYQIKFTVGDTFLITKPYPAIDMPGLGQCDLLANTFNPTPVYLNFQTNIVHNWANTLYTFFDVPTLISSGAVSPYPNIINGRDYTNTSAINYTPYPYPNPNLVTANPIIPPVIVPVSSVGFIGKLGHIGTMR